MTQNSFGLESAAVSDRGLSEKRPQNEDSYLETPSRGLFAVADGVGGAQAGDVASQMAMEILQEAFANLPEGGDVEELMRVAIERANGAIYQMSHDLPQLSTMATTIVALHVADNIATIGHVGDSRIYRVDSRGNLFRETQDHSVVEEEVRAGRMTAAQAATHPSRNVISRALGAENTVEIDMKTIMFEPNTTFLLCSDGITRHIEDHELRELLKSDHPTSQICEDMKNICYGRGAEDNLTAVIVRVAATSAENLADAEEPTVATARLPMVNTGVFASAASAPDSGDVSTQNLQAPESVDFATRESYDASQFDLSPDEDSVEATTGEMRVQPLAETPIVSNNFERVEKVERVESEPEIEEKKAGSFFGKLISSLALLLVGAALGAAGYYFWKQSQPQQTAPAVVQEPQKITQMQAPDIAYKAFEDNRRNVDKDPTQFIKTYGDVAKDAEDFYLIGRAYLWNEEYVKAKTSFTRANELLLQSDKPDKTMLANEITIGLSIVDSGFAKNVIENRRKKSNPTQSPTVNENSNTEQFTNSSASQNANGN